MKRFPDSKLITPIERSNKTIVKSHLNRDFVSLTIIKKDTSQLRENNSPYRKDKTELD